MWLLLLPVIPVVLIVTIFLVAHRRERGLPIIERRLSLSLWICLGLVGLLERRMPDRVSKKYVYPPLALTIALTPLWGALLLDRYNAYREDSVRRQREKWIEQNAESTINSIQLEQCSSFALIPSSEHPGIMDIQVSVAVRVNESREFTIIAGLRKVTDSRTDRLDVITIGASFTG
jgi:hypothetical protein